MRWSRLHAAKNISPDTPLPLSLSYCPTIPLHSLPRAASLALHHPLLNSLTFMSALPHGDGDDGKHDLRVDEGDYDADGEGRDGGRGGDAADHAILFVMGSMVKTALLAMLVRPMLLVLMLI